VRTAFNSNQSPSSLSVKLREKSVSFTFGLMEPWRDHPLGAHRIGRRWSAVAEFPLQRSCLQLNPVLVLLCGDNREVIAPQDCDESSNESLSVVARKVFSQMPESFLAQIFA
jgi:hypothetical protein